MVKVVKLLALQFELKLQLGSAGLIVRGELCERVRVVNERWWRGQGSIVVYDGAHVGDGVWRGNEMTCW